MSWRGPKKSQDLLALESSVAVFNHEYQVGSPVTVSMGNGEYLATITASNAWIRSDGLVVVMLKGVPGSFQIANITHREEKPT